MTKIHKTASLIIVALMLSLSAYAQQVIQNRTYESGEQEQRNTTGSISTADSVVVKPDAKVDWESFTKIHLTPGFRAQPGANFHAVVPDPDAFVLVALDGDNQSAAPGEVNAKPFDLAVWQHQAPVINMPVTLTVLSGGGSLMSSPTSGGVNSLTLMSDSVGTVQAWFRQPGANNVTSVIRATSNGKILDLHSYNFETSLAYGNGSGNGSGGNGGVGGGDPNAPGNSNGNAPDWTKGREGDNAAGFVVFSPEGENITTVTGGAASTQPSVLLTPTMTNNTAPAPYVASASSIYDANYQPFRAFDRVQNTSNVDAFASKSGFDLAGNGHEWLMIDLGATRTLTNYVLRARGFPQLAINDTQNGFPANFTLQVSTDGTNFAIVDTQNNTPMPTTAYQPYAFTLSTPVQARFIKIDVTKVTTHRASEQFTIGELELYGY